MRRAKAPLHPSVLCVLLMAACARTGQTPPQELASVTSDPEFQHRESPVDPGLAEPPQANPQLDEPQLQEDEARSRLQASCEARCGTVVDREAIIRHIVTIGTIPSTAGSRSLAESHGISGREPTDAEKEQFMSFVRGEPATIMYRGPEIWFNPERVELDGRFGSAIFIDETNHVVACIASDPALLPYAVRVDC